VIQLSDTFPQIIHNSVIFSKQLPRIFYWLPISQQRSTFKPKTEGEFISADQYKIHHCILLEVFISDYQYFA
jgi:hypothetical protein